MNYYGQDMHHKEIPYESLEVFTIGNVKEGSKWYDRNLSFVYVLAVFPRGMNQDDLNHSSRFFIILLLYQYLVVLQR